jgi:DNA-directed RNA polymerase specialized sigma24 family protein
MSFNNESTLTDYIEYDDGQHETHMDDIVATKAELVKTTIEGLPLKYRNVMTMREIDGMSYKDIAYNSKLIVTLICVMKE